ncbi:MAG TPA: cell envelope integrity protein CreD [Luteimonas sp.]|nr:cell envelope integrity protein CreD [Luteimonas sp.]
MKLTPRILMVAGMTLAILVPLLLIRGLIHERQAYRLEAVRAVTASYAAAQALAGPVLVVPYVETFEVERADAQGVVRRVRQEVERQWTYFPEALDVDGELKPSARRRGLHEVRVYELAAAIDARFDVAIPGDADAVVPRRIGRPWLAYGIGDVRGLRGTPVLRVAGKTVAVGQGLGARAGSGLHARLAAPVAGGRITFDSRLDLALGGTESLAIAPVARRNHVAIRSSWPHPQFNGAFLPRTSRIGAGGFVAGWEVSALASNAQAQYRAGASLPAVAGADGEGGPTAAGLDGIGISLLDPVNPYTQADRASKYGVLFVLLTFVGFFMFELLKSLRIHPIQYALVGLALAIFFLLLVSLSEHIAFAWAYLVASGACIGLLGFYLSYVLRSRTRAAGFAAMLATLYAALYGLLASEDNALVLGSALLFVVLAALMVATRRIDWYRLSALPDSTT